MNSQKLRKSFGDMERAIAYFGILSHLNQLNLTNKQIEMLAFISTKGEISKSGNVDAFITTFNSTLNSVNNLLWKLKRKGMLVKDGRYLVLHPGLKALDFTKPIILQITLDELR